jgi:hypothetical protein
LIARETSTLASCCWWMGTGSTTTFMTRPRLAPNFP